jgi:SAM-dependent methyltransferase
MTTPFTYDFGYSWSVAWGHVVPAVVFGILLGLSLWRRWPTWLTVTFGLVATWAATAVFAVQVLLGINLPVRIPSAQFMAGGAGHVLDIGAGSGRATIGLLLARPELRVTAVDLYSGYYGIDNNTPARLLDNARRAGVAARVDVKVGDARRLPFDPATFDGAISTYAIDHMNWQGTTAAVEETSRVLKPGGQFLLEIVNADAWVHLLMPVLHGGGHFRPSPDRWRRLLRDSGFEVVEEGSRPATLYWLARKRAP